MHMIHLKTNAFSKCRLVRSNCFFYNHSENKSFSSPLLQHEISVNYYLILHVFCRVIKTIYFYKNVNSKILTFIKKNQMLLGFQSFLLTLSLQTTILWFCSFCMQGIGLMMKVENCPIYFCLSLLKNLK